MASTSSSTTIPSWFPSTPAPVYGIILAATTGTRLFPLTSSSGALSSGSAFLPKHLLPVAGMPCLTRLLDSLCLMSVQNIVLTISADDTATVPTLLGQPNQEFVQVDNKDDESKSIKDGTSNKKWTLVRKKNLSGKDSQPLKQTITIMALSKDFECFGSIDAWKQIELAKIIPESSHVVILPGDLVLSSLEEETKTGTVGQSSSLFGLDSMFRRPTSVTNSQQPAPACTMVLVDVGEQDENGIPLKESAKAKKGGLARDEDEIEYIALSYPSRAGASSLLPRVVWKQAIVDVEAANNDMSGNSTKLILPKPRLRGSGGPTVIRSDWNDTHIYAFAPWVRKLIVQRTKNMVSIEQDLIPLLVARQFQGQRATFGKQKDEQKLDENSNSGNMDRTFRDEDDINNEGKEDDLYSVVALVIPNEGKSTIVRSHTTAAYLFANRELVSRGGNLPMPSDAKWNGKFQTLVLNGTDGSNDNATKLGAKITMKSSVIGRHCDIGAKCRLNNVVIMDNVTIGENCSLQNTIISSGATLGANCSLNDCLVGPKANIASGTKEKGEAFSADDDHDEEYEGAVLVSDPDGEE